MAAQPTETQRRQAQDPRPEEEQKRREIGGEVETEMRQDVGKKTHKGEEKTTPKQSKGSGGCH